MMKAPVGGAKHQLLPSCSLLALLAAFTLPTQVQAQVATPPLTRAGTTISNTASATFDTGGGSTTINSNRVDLLVDELLDVTVDSSNPADVPTTPGATGQVLTFSVTNTGNGVENFVLSTIANAGGDNYDPVVTQIYIDNGDGVFDPGTDTLYTPGANDPQLDPDESVTVFVVATTPGGVVDGNRGIVSLVAAAVTGTGAPGTSFAGQGEGGGDAVVGSTGADGADAGAFIVSAATVTLVKSAVVTNPLGTADPIPGATITYTIVATVAGSGSVSGLAITDNIPADTSYVTGSITLGGVAQSDAVDADAGDYNGTRINVALGTVAGGQTRTVTFRTTID
ncbi:DUF11 domain-containing protein [Sphingopyxis sp. L1A2A]|uniref:DUF11 domain-containing protein n=1 Tax=Sphingopyxis sp. L1A2A TaxID=2502247 RepID=UPI0010F76E20|nr:DUF11 domain-containing protein [Sphingopyxis sp. L1A2A]